ncbi:MAG: hypothetical protein ACLPVO_17500 [Desulfomonilaceae bacterium]
MDPILVCANDRTFNVWTNPSVSQLEEIGSLVRFTADNKTRNVYVWEFNSGRHGNVSVGLKLDDPFNSLDFLKGHAGKNDKGTYQMVGSDFLQSFVGRLAGKEKVFLSNLLNQEWDWVDSYIKVTGWLRSFRERTLI